MPIKCWLEKVSRRIPLLGKEGTIEVPESISGTRAGVVYDS